MLAGWIGWNARCGKGALMAEPVALAALGLDALLGWPAWLHRRVGHPVGAFATAISACERRWNRPDRSNAARRTWGVLTVLVVGGGTFLLCFRIEQAVRFAAGPYAGALLALLAWPALAMRSLDDHVRPVIAALAADDLVAAREAVGMIVGRDTAELDHAGVARAAIESLAESFCDGVVAPLFWLLTLGLPGAWTYKAINTADSLIGHREEPFTDFGRAAARSDDVLNLIPARLSALLLCLAGSGAGGGGWRIGWKYRYCHASPNSGWPEAAMAGVLGVRLAGPLSYDGQLVDKPWIGEGAEARLGALVSARRVYHRACALVGVVAAGIWAAGIWAAGVWAGGTAWLG